VLFLIVLVIVIDLFGFRENFKIDYEGEDDAILPQKSLG